MRTKLVTTLPTMTQQLPLTHIARNNYCKPQTTQPRSSEPAQITAMKKNFAPISDLQCKVIRPVHIRSTPRMHSSQIPHRRSPPPTSSHTPLLSKRRPVGFQRFLAIHRPRPSCIPHLPHTRCRPRYLHRHINVTLPLQILSRSGFKGLSQSA